MKTFINGGEVKKMFIAGNEVKSLFKNGVKVYENTLNDGLILDLPLQNNFTDYSASGISMVAGGTSNQPTFALSGRKAGEYCTVFNGSQSIKTTTNLPINSDKVTVAFWMKTTQTDSRTVVSELSPNYDANNAFCVYLNDLITNRIEIADHISNYNAVNSGVNVNTGSWFHIVMTIDRGQNGVDQNKVYVNGSLSSIDSSYKTDHNVNFVNNILYIGQKAGNALGFKGSLTLLKIYNYPFTATEVTNLHNSEL